STTIQSVVVDDRAGKCEFSELIRGSESKDIRIERDAVRIVAHQTILNIVQRHPQLVGWLVSNSAAELKQQARAGIERGATNCRNRALAGIAESRCGCGSGTLRSQQGPCS